MPVVIRNVILNNPDYADCDLAGSTIRDAVVTGGNFADSDLAGSTIRDSVFNMVSFRGADLRRATIRDCVFNACDFQDALTEGATIRDTHGLSPATPKRKAQRQMTYATVDAHVVSSTSVPSQGAARPSRKDDDEKE